MDREDPIDSSLRTRAGHRPALHRPVACALPRCVEDNGSTWPPSGTVRAHALPVPGCGHPARRWSWAFRSGHACPREARAGHVQDVRCVGSQRRRCRRPDDGQAPRSCRKRVPSPRYRRTFEHARAARGHREWTLAGIAAQGIDECGCDLGGAQHAPAQGRFALAWQEHVRRWEYRRQQDGVLRISDVAMPSRVLMVVTTMHPGCVADRVMMPEWARRTSRDDDACNRHRDPLEAANNVADCSDDPGACNSRTVPTRLVLPTAAQRQQCLA